MHTEHIPQQTHMPHMLHIQWQDIPIIQVMHVQDHLQTMETFAMVTVIIHHIP